MSKKDGQLLIKINKDEKKEFLKVCEENDASASKVVRRMISEYVKKNSKKS